MEHLLEEFHCLLRQGPLLEEVSQLFPSLAWEVEAKDQILDFLLVFSQYHTRQIFRTELFTRPCSSRFIWDQFYPYKLGNHTSKEYHIYVDLPFPCICFHPHHFDYHFLLSFWPL
jgi:hypothetical protein